MGFAMPPPDVRQAGYATIFLGGAYRPSREPRNTVIRALDLGAPWLSFPKSASAADVMVNALSFGILAAAIYISAPKPFGRPESKEQPSLSQKTVGVLAGRFSALRKRQMEVLGAHDAGEEANKEAISTHFSMFAEPTRESNHVTAISQGAEGLQNRNGGRLLQWDRWAGQLPQVS